MESADSISPPSFFARATASADFPDAVGPTTKRTSGLFFVRVFIFGVARGTSCVVPLHRFGLRDAEKFEAVPEHDAGRIGQKKPRLGQFLIFGDHTMMAIELMETSGHLA